MKSFLYKFIFLIYILLDILTLLFCKWLNTPIKIIIYITSLLIFITSIYLLLYFYIMFDLKIKFNNNSKCYNFFYGLLILSNIIILLIIGIKPFIILSNINYNYLRECPFTLKSNLMQNKVSYNEKRRCELYNIYMNSRYKYQYICSYDAYEDFKYNRTEDGLNKVVCVQKVKSIEDNDIINRFIELYKSQNINTFFYCNRIYKPVNNKNYKDEYCNMNINILYFFSLLYFLNIILYVFHLSLYDDIYHRNDLIEEQRPNIDYDDSDLSTECGEGNINNIIFHEEIDKNIIIENHEIYIIEVNIKNFLENEEKLRQSLFIEENSIQNILTESDNN